MLTSNARERLRSVETVIIDEIHALVSTKRGAHMALSLERLEAARAAAAAAAHRAVGDAAAARRSGAVSRGRRARRRRCRRTEGRRHAGRTKAATGAKAAGIDRGPEDVVDDEFAAPTGAVSYRDVTIIDASEPKRLDIRVQVPIEDMAKVGAAAGADGDHEFAAARGAVAGAAVDLDRDSSAAARADSGASLDADLRQQPAAGRAARRRAQRAGGRAAGARASRVARARAARRNRGSAQGRTAARLWSRPARSSSASTWARSISSCRSKRRRRSPAGCSASDAPAIASTQVSTGIIFPKFRGDLVSCAAVTRAMMTRRGRAVALSAQSARRAGAADRRDGRRWSTGPSTICSTRCAAPRRTPS